MNKEKNNKIELCSCNIIHEDRVEKVTNNMINEDLLEEAADLFKVFGDRTRIKIINALSLSEMCVCDLAYVLKMTHSAISHQLRVLKAARVVKYRKDGKVVYYSLDDEHIKAILGIAIEHIKE